MSAIVGGSFPSAAQARKLYPVDEGKKNPSFRAFRQKLIAALERRDRTFLLSVVDPKIEYTFGGSGGISGFQKQWNLNRTGASWNPLRQELLTLLALGGSFHEGKFWAPYVYSNWPEGYENETDAFTYSAVVGRQVAVRSQPAATSPLVTRLTYDLVKRLETPDGRSWVKIVTPNGRRGYVNRQYLRSPVGYRAGFRKVKGKWKLIALVAGD